MHKGSPIFHRVLGYLWLRKNELSNLAWLRKEAGIMLLQAV